MKLPPHLEAIKKQLIADEITWLEATEALKELKEKKPWRSKEWKAERDKIIKDSCEACGTEANEAIMVLQHLWKPRTAQNILYDLKDYIVFNSKDQRAQWVAERKENSEEIKNIVMGDRECCPKCNSVSIKKLKTKQVWKCYGTKTKKASGRYSRKVTCEHEFDEPATTKDFTPDQKNEITRIHREIWDEAQAKFNVDFARIDELYGKKAVLESFKDSERYYSLKDTATFCKKCAYLMDVKKLLFCPNCQEHHTLFHIIGCVPDASKVLGFDFIRNDPKGF